MTIVGFPIQRLIYTINCDGVTPNVGNAKIHMKKYISAYLLVHLPSQYLIPETIQKKCFKNVSSVVFFKINVLVHEF